MWFSFKQTRGNQELCLPAADTSGVYKVVNTTMTFATEEQEPEAAVADAAADNADDTWPLSMSGRSAPNH